MKKIAIIILTIVLILSSIQFATVGSKEENMNHYEYHKEFHKLTITKNQDYLTVDIEGTNDFINAPTEPKLPVYHHVFKLPAQSKVESVSLSHAPYQTEKIQSKVQPVPQTQYKMISAESQMQIKEHEHIYKTNAFYPEQWYTYSIRYGLDIDGTPTLFVITDVYPIRYNPITEELHFITDIILECDYSVNPKEPTSASVPTYDLVIIAPTSFSSELDSLISHKNTMGLNTILKTTEDIYNEFQGRDKPEQIKYFIKHAKEEWNTSYVLIVGGLTSYLYAKDKDDQNQGSAAWHVPVRYTNVKESNEVGCISDLYYADLYRYNEETQEREFEDWDSSGDGIFAKWGFLDRDRLDLIPDIYVGRLPCRNKLELQIIRDKIITYESTSPDEKPWYNKMIAVAGKNFDLWQGQPDGEFLTDRAIENMTGVVDEVVRIYASNNLTGDGPVPDTEDIIEEFSKGAGFIDFEGHGNPISWAVIKADGEYEDHDWHGGIDISDFLSLENGDKLPVVMVGGCHNGLLNVSIFRILLTRSQHYNWYWSWTPTPLCFCWAMVVKPNGGAIASIGASGLGPASGNDPLSLLGEIDLDFFYVIGQESLEKLGEGHSGAITKYVTDNDMRQRETFTTTVFQLFGDPSLQLGGYS